MRQHLPVTESLPGDPFTQPTPQQTPLPCLSPSPSSWSRFLCLSRAGERGPPTRPRRRTPRVPADVTATQSHLPPDCSLASKFSAFTNLWGRSLGAGDTWEAEGVAWGLRRVSLGPRSPRCQSHCLWAQCCYGKDVPPTPCRPSPLPPPPPPVSPPVPHPTLPLAPHTSALDLPTSAIPQGHVNSDPLPGRLPSPPTLQPSANLTSFHPLSRVL